MTKQRKNCRLNAPVKNLVVYAGSDENAKVICSASGDIAGTLKRPTSKFSLKNVAEGRQVSPYDVYIKAEY